jgi:hypothetical protein
MMMMMKGKTMVEIKTEEGFLVSQFVGERVKVRLNIEIHDEDQLELPWFTASLLGVDRYGILIAFSDKDKRFFAWSTIQEVRPV